MRSGFIDQAKFQRTARFFRILNNCVKRFTRVFGTKRKSVTATAPLALIIAEKETILQRHQCAVFFAP